MVMDVYIYSNCRHTGTVQSISNLHFTVELLYRQYADLHTAKCSNLRSIHRRFIKSPHNRREGSVDQMAQTRVTSVLRIIGNFSLGDYD